MPRFVIAFAAFFGLVFGFANVARAEFKVEISGVGITQFPIGISDFKGADSAPQRITQILRLTLTEAANSKHLNSLLPLMKTLGLTLQASKPKISMAC